MGIFQNNLMGAAAAAASAGGDGFYDYQIANSCRFGVVNSYLTRAISGVTDNTQNTISFWVKRSRISGSAANGRQPVMGNSGGAGQLEFLDADTFRYASYGKLESNVQLFRDTSAWYHIHIYRSTSDGGGAIYVNGVQVSLTTNTAGSDGIFQNGQSLQIGASNNGSTVFDGYIAEVYGIYDQNIAHTEFGEFKNGVWIPKNAASAITFGTHDFYLKFESSTDLGNDSSGNNNDFTATNMSAHDQMLDSPTFNSSSNGGNYCTLNNLFPDPTVARITNGNLQWGGSEGGGSVNEMGCMSTFAISPSDTNIYYFEARMKASPSGGVEQSVGVNVPTVDLTSDRGGRPTAWCISNNDDQRIYNGANSYTTTGVSGSAGDIVGVEIDRANTTIKFYVNGTLRGTQTNLNTTTDLYPWVGTGGSTSDTLGWDLNFGQNGTFNGLVTAQGESDATGYGNFYYDEAGSCKALCAGNLPVAAEVDPAQTDDDYPQKLFGAKLYTGNGGTNAITGLGFKPDVVWGKSRSNTQDHFLADSTNGTGKDLIPNSNVAQQTENGVTSFDTDGWTMGSIYNATAYTYVAWNWRANGGTTSTNTQGDITSTVQVDPSGCFSIVTYTGESATRTIGHGLSATPTTIWVKSIASSYGWANYFKDNGLNKLAFNSLGNDTGASTLWGNTHPTSSVFSVGDGSETGKSTTYVAYCFAPCEGYISIGSYVANGSSTNNTFVYTGFRPAFLLVKGLVTGAAWTLIDNKRDGYNPTPESLEPNSAGASYTSAAPFADLLSNGFKVRTNNAVMGSTSYGPYVYVAMAETPFKYATAR
jgi:hypothetical protein